MLKKIIAALMALTLLAGSALAEEDWYLKKGLALAGRLGALAADEGYLQVYTASPDIADAALAFGQSDLSAPISAKMLILPDDEVSKSIVRMAVSAAGGSLSDAATEQLARGLPTMLVSALNARQSQTWLALSSVLGTGESYLQPEAFTPGVLALEYPECAVAVAFSYSGEGIVSAHAAPAPSGMLDGILEALDGELPRSVGALLKSLIQDVPLE